jgi:hypothetical protein
MDTEERLWRFFDYAGPGYSVEDWYQSLDELGQRIFKGLLKTNAKAHIPKDWQGSKTLKGEGKEEGVWEWRFYSGGCQQRVCGIFGSVRRHAIFLIGCNHKQNIYHPPKCIETAVKRAQEVRKGTVQLNERSIDSDI